MLHGEDVILSAAKDLYPRRNRPFAEFTLERSEGLKVTIDGKLRPGSDFATDYKI